MKIDYYKWTADEWAWLLRHGVKRVGRRPGYRPGRRSLARGWAW